MSGLKYNYLHCYTCSDWIVSINFAQLEEHHSNDEESCDVSKKNYPINRVGVRLWFDKATLSRHLWYLKDLFHDKTESYAW